MLKGFATHESVATTVGANSIIPSAPTLANIAQRAWDDLKQGKAIAPDITPKSLTELQGMITKIKSDPVSNLLFTSLDKVITKVVDVPVSISTVIATVMACAHFESRFNVNAVADLMDSPKFRENLASDPDAAMASAPGHAKGILQLLPRNFRRLYQRIDTDPGYAPLKTAMQQAGVFESIKKIDRDYSKFVKDNGIPTEHLGSHPVSQIIPSIAFVTDAVRTISREWTFNPGTGWQPRMKPVDWSRLTAMWAMVPGAKNDPDLGFALLYNIYHVSGNGIVRGDFKFHSTAGNNYQNRVNLAASFIANPDLILKNSQFFGL